jgi:hypothetical protein
MAMTVKLSAGLHLVLASLTFAAPTVQAQSSNTFDEAMQAFSVQHFRRAFDSLAHLADAGDGEAARIALLMVAHGPRLFGERFDVAAPQRARWLDLASRSALARVAAQAH